MREIFMKKTYGLLAVAAVAYFRLAAAPFEASAPAKLGRALTAFDAAHKRRI